MKKNKEKIEKEEIIKDIVKDKEDIDIKNMPKKEKIKEKKKESTFYKTLSTFTLILSIAYLTYCLLITDSILTNIMKISIPLFIFVISFSLFIVAIKSNEKTCVTVSSIILLLFMGFYFLNDINIISLPQEEKLISYVNSPYKNLNDWASNNKIELNIEYEYSDTIEKGNIIRLDVSEGTLVKDIKKITATVSDGPDYDKIVVVPSMIGWNIDNVSKFIKDNHIIGVIIEYEFSDEAKDNVIKQNKNGDIRRDQEWILTLSLGNIEELEKEISLINLKGKTLFDATLWLKRNNIKYTVEYEFSDNIDKNVVINQNIGENEIINIDETSVILTASKGKAIVVPNLLKMSVDEITNWVIENKLKVNFNEIYDEKVETGKIINASVKENDKIEANTTITVTISKGQIKMQKFSSLYEFKEWANKYNIAYSESYEYSNIVSKGSVISYSYKENEIINPDDVIYIKVSLGTAITIPSFIGKTKAEATRICNNLGIRCVFNTGGYTQYKANIIYSQSRAQGNKVASGSTITLTLSKGIPETKVLYIQTNWLVIGNADGTISSLKKEFANNFPGVNFNFIKVKDNTLQSGMIPKNSPANYGTSVKQGQTYTIYVVSN